jgi:hypothetical protein
MDKMKNEKPLSEPQKRRLGVVLEALNTPIFSMLIFVKTTFNQLTRKFGTRKFIGSNPLLKYQRYIQSKGYSSCSGCL